MQSKRNATVQPKPLSAAAVKRMEADGERVWRLRDGTAFASRAERRVARKGQS